MRWNLAAASVVSLGVLSACSGSSTSSSSGDGGPTTNPNEQTVAIGPIPVAAGQEETVCIVIPFGATEDVVVNSIDVNLAPGSHHLIVYQSTVAPTSTPYPCSPFTGIAFGSDVPFVFSGREQLTWTFPQGVGLDVPANTFVKIEAHYINTTSAELQGHGQVTFHTTPKATMGPYKPAGFSFWGTMNIDIPPNASASTGVQFQAGVANTHLISISTHQHRLGTGVMAWESEAPGQMGTQIAKDLDWANPSWSLLNPQYDFNGTNGLSYECNWTNTTSQAITFGESALDEMCFVGGYFYPGSGLDFCINGHCKNRP
jgi:hypothetical protein